MLRADRDTVTVSYQLYWSDANTSPMLLREPSTLGNLNMYAFMNGRQNGDDIFAIDAAPTRAIRSTSPKRSSPEVTRSAWKSGTKCPSADQGRCASPAPT